MIVVFYLHSSVWFTNPVGTNLVMFNLYKKKHNVGKLIRYDHTLLAIFEFRGFYFSLRMLVETKMRWPLGGNFKLPTWFITGHSTEKLRTSDRNLILAKSRLLANE
jgi:hypothetical protein